MTPTPLSAAELDQILRDNIHTRNGIEWIKNKDLDGVVASYRLLAERLAEAEKVEQHARSLIDYREKGLRERIAALEGEISTLTKQQDKLLRTCDALRAQLATSHAARLTAEARTAELRDALEQFADRGNWDEVVIDDTGDGARDYWDHSDYLHGYDLAAAALATPDTGASAVLAAADEFIALDDKLKGTYKDAINGSWVGNLEVLRQAVHARLAARGEGGAGG